jgi:hypothetical protein
VDFIIIILVIIFIVALIAPKPGQPGGPALGDKFVVQKKQCPPHQWFWQEIVDQDGKKHGERIVCKVCGPLRPLGGREDEV